MTWSDLRLRLRAFFFRQKVEDELAEEVQFHLEMATRKHLKAGLRVEDAKRKVSIQFGGVTQVKEECRDMRGLHFIETVLQDIRYALAGFRRTPGFALTVIATIALGLGLNTALFTVFNAYVMQPLNVRDPYSLYQFAWVDQRGVENRNLGWNEFQNLRRENVAFSEVAGVDRLSMMRVEGHLFLGELVTGNYFQMLNVVAARGRTLLPEDAEVPGSGPIAVVSFDAWTNKFASDPEIIGKELVIRGRRVKVIGVAQANFRGVGEVPPDVWLPITLSTELEEGDSLFGPKQPERLLVLGRLRHDLTVRQAEAALTAWTRVRTAKRPDRERVASVTLQSRATIIALDPLLAAAIAPVMVAFGLVLVIACANVANMMLARAMARQREIGVRLAMGAGRSRLIRQLLTESLVLALPAGAAAFVISEESIRWGERLMLATLPGGVVEIFSLVPKLEADWRVLGFMLAGAMLSAILFGLVPAIQATRKNVMEAARGEFTTDFGASRLRNALVIGQVTVSALLLILAAVLLRANGRMENADVGLDPKGVLEVGIQEQFRATVLQQIAVEPGVESIAAASKIPFMGSLAAVPVVAGDGMERVRAGYLYASPEYFPAFRLPILRGRNFTREEAEDGAAVAIISQATAERLWPGKNALGQSIRLAPDPQQPHSLADPAEGLPAYRAARVIGIARDALTGWVGDGTDQTCVYFPTTPGKAGNILLVRVRGDEQVAQRKLDASLGTSAPGAINQMHLMDERLEAQLYPFRALYWLSSGVGGLALLLTLTGIYGVLSYVVTQRTKEIGIRVALGARPGAVAGLVLRQSLRFALIGGAIGATAAVGAVRLVTAQVEMRTLGTFDWVAFGIGLLLVTVASAAAAWMPSRRAARVEPLTALRND